MLTMTDKCSVSFLLLLLAEILPGYEGYEGCVCYFRLLTLSFGRD